MTLTVFSRLKYPKHLVNSAIKSCVDSKVCDQQRSLSPTKESHDTVRVAVPFKDQISANIVKEQLKDMSLEVNTTIQPVFVSRKIEQELSVKVSQFIEPITPVRLLFLTSPTNGSKKWMIVNLLELSLWTSVRLLT